MNALWMTASVLGVVLAQANPADRMALAAMRLAEQPNYTWTSVVTDDAQSYAIEGKTRDGYTWLRLPMVPTLARRLGRDADVEIEAFFRGGDNAVIRTERGWHTLNELPKRAHDWRHGSPSRGARYGGSSFSEENSRPYSNAQFGLARPHDELAVIVSSYVDLKASGDLVAGTLTDLGAQLLLVRDGQDHIEPLCAAGTFTLLIKNGVVVRYLLRLEGILLVERRKVHVRQASSTTIGEIGTTRFSVPDEAARKLEM